ncbi:MAG TPA: ATPase domain-containing protein [Methanomassiliicoccales archaeon]
MDQRPRYRTHVHGLDENIGGGIPEGSVVLICGTAGTMKSSLAYYMLYTNARDDAVPGLYISLEQSRDSLLRQMHGLGFDGKLKANLDILDLGELRMKTEGSNWLDTFKYAIEETRKRMNYDLLVIDSLGALTLISEFERPREEIFRLFEWLRSMAITTMVISEMPVGMFQYYGGEDTDFLSDGILHLRMVDVGETDVQRRLRCVKLRETDHSSSYYSFYYKDKGFFITRAISDL